MGIYCDMGTDIAKAVTHKKSLQDIGIELIAYKAINPTINYFITRSTDHEESKKEYGSTGWVLWAIRHPGQ